MSLHRNFKFAQRNVCPPLLLGEGWGGGTCMATVIMEMKNDRFAR